ncbi:protein of unknown function [Taphrina deformans PYCC 5710]|uniref:ENTH domain-containing protein n=1 Tax=Taphrina deformans (strain PYCC 5710 / ATCC 11124 / CBS 356.35 / IMI 108563 / JCM 9778 / NBRC 8474) TaxID=1097556 RepID=R4XF89_TAPDE|nr:protein of unknown function [Taphrina deformans PYCC 5710]|eukprot:CCG84446.1 protein of unknown function [Taphrina deformans PYCC 5710]
MSGIDNAADFISNLTASHLYDIKSAVRKVQNVVMNFTEMEAKVREATNNEPWGASSTQLNEIADGTHSFSQFNEIMPMIYKRFTEKSAEEWRQIYKALQLLEYLVKNGSERVIDDARSHISTIKMLRNFHYIDEKMKDQGINVRNRAKELSELLQDSEQIRAERRKAKTNTKKFGAVSSESAFTTGGASGGFGGSGKKYGGFSSDDYGSSSAGAIYGDGGGFTSNTSTAGRIYGDGGGTSTSGSPAFGESSSAAQTARREKSKQQRAAAGFAEGALGSVQAPAERFDEYDEYDAGPSAGPSTTTTTSSSMKTTMPKPIPKKAEPPKPKAKEVDLFSFDDEATPVTNSKSTGQALPTIVTQQDDDDEFDDFQSASTAMAAPQPVKAASLMNVMGPASPQKPQGAGMPDLFPAVAPPAFQSAPAPQLSAFSGLTSPVPQQVNAGPPKTQSGPNYYATGMFQTQTTGNTLQAVTPVVPVVKPKSVDAFGDLLSGFKKPEKPKGESLAEMNKKTASAGIWGAPKPPVAHMTNDDDDFGDFSGSGSASKAQSSNADLLF